MEGTGVAPATPDHPSVCGWPSGTKRVFLEWLLQGGDWKQNPAPLRLFPSFQLPFGHCHYCLGCHGWSFRVIPLTQVPGFPPARHTPISPSKCPHRSFPIN